jgi:mRNA interferase MazF
MSDLLPGEIVVLPFPYTDLSSSKLRPALVISDAEFNEAGPDVVVCAITSRLRNSSQSVLIGQEDLERGALPRPSRVKVANVVTIDKTIVRKRVARLKPAPFARVMREFESMFTNG